MVSVRVAAAQDAVVCAEIVAGLEGGDEVRFEGDDQVGGEVHPVDPVDPDDPDRG